MIKVKRLRHVTIISPGIEAQLDYYQSVIGLSMIQRDDHRIYLGTDSYPGQVIKIGINGKK